MRSRDHRCTGGVDPGRHATFATDVPRCRSAISAHFMIEVAADLPEHSLKPIQFRSLGSRGDIMADLSQFQHPRAVPDLDVLAGCIREGFDAVIALADIG
jgi:hypothetical protein